MRKKTRNVSIVVGVVAVVILSLMLLGNSKVQTSLTQTSIYDSFAQCIADSGAEMYGAYWCPVCNEQKNAFGSGEKNLPYIECSLQNSRTQTIACRKASIEAYPTWKFTDGTEYVGQLTLEDLAVRTSCALPTEHQMPLVAEADTPTEITEDLPDETISKNTASSSDETATSTANADIVVEETADADSI